MQHYNNAVLNLTKEATPDPYVTSHNNRFYLTFTAGDRIEVWSADSLPDFYEHPQKNIIWRPPPDTEHSSQLWAPELHSLHGRWYVYFAACHPATGNKGHRMFVLGGPAADRDPVGGAWEFLGPLRGMPEAQWAIDGTVLELDAQLFFVYSGWPLENPGESDLIQRLFIVRLADPVTAATAPVEICRPQEAFEHSGDHRINEGPQYLASGDGRWRGIAYSCAGSWTKEYKMNTLRFGGGDALEPGNWHKALTPLIQNGAHGRGPWGPGHGSFVHVGEDVVGVYHATDEPTDGWRNRRARMQRVVFTPEGPSMGGGVGVVAADFQAFVGDAGPRDGHKKHGLKTWLKTLKDEL